MKNRSIINIAVAVNIAVAAIIAAGSLGAQSSSPTLIGAWRADAPLPNGVVQTFRFDPDGRFGLSAVLDVDGSYRVDGNQLIETVVLAIMGVTHTDTATFVIRGDSLIVSESAGTPARVLRRSGTPTAGSAIVGDWVISVGSSTSAHYTFAANGKMHVRAQVGDEAGKYTVRADTLHLSDDQTFQLAANAQFAVADSVLTLTPLNGKPARQFHRVAPKP